MRKEITNAVGKWWVVANRCGDLHVTDGDMPERAGSGWQGMKRFWCCRDLEGAANEEVFLFVGEEPPIMDDDGEWIDPRKEGLFWSEEDFNFDFGKLLGTVKFPELNKGERIEMNLQFEFGIK